MLSQLGTFYLAVNRNFLFGSDTLKTASLPDDWHVFGLRLGNQHAVEGSLWVPGSHPAHFPQRLEKGISQFKLPFEHSRRAHFRRP
jgi:hypothetical protein